MFDELSDIKKARKIEQQDKSRLEVLLETGDKIINKYLPHFLVLSSRNEYTDENIYFSYNSIYEDLSKIDLISFIEDDIAQLIRVKSAVEFQNIESNSIFGLYTSVLLHILTERNEQQGKRTIMHLKDIAMDYLFHYVHKADTIILENCQGNEILNLAGSFDGAINTIVLNHFGNNDGNDTDILSDIAANNGFVNTVILYDVKGSVVASRMAFNNGKVNLLLAHSIDSLLFGSNLCTLSGVMNLCYLDTIAAKNSFLSSACAIDGYIDSLFINAVKSDYFLSTDFSGLVDSIFIDGYSNKPNQSNVIRKLVHSTLVPDDAKAILRQYNITTDFIDQQVDLNKIPDSAKDIFQQYYISYLLQLTKNLTNENVAEIVRISDIIKTIKIDTIKYIRNNGD